MFPIEMASQVLESCKVGHCSGSRYNLYQYSYVGNFGHSSVGFHVIPFGSLHTVALCNGFKF